MNAIDDLLEKMKADLALAEAEGRRLDLIERIVMAAGLVTCVVLIILWIYGS